MRQLPRGLQGCEFEVQSVDEKEERRIAGNENQSARERMAAKGGVPIAN
jgi:hypothetical protein